MTLKRMWLIIALAARAAFAAAEVRTVDLLPAAGLEFNAAGPLLVRMDAARGRLIVANTLSSAVTLIDCRSRSVRNVPVASRVPQHLKSEALAVDSRSGNVYVIGDRTLEVVFAASGTSRSFPTRRQFETVAVDEATGNAFLVGRESRDMAVVDLKKGRVAYIPWSEGEDVARNLNQTPPPPLRKVVCDSAARIVLAVDGTTATLHCFDASSLKRLRSRPLGLLAGGRWHFAGYSARRLSLYLVVETAERKVLQAARISAADANDEIVALPGLTEAVGVNYSEKRNEVYIPYDNHPTLHVVDFNDSASPGGPAVTPGPTGGPAVAPGPTGGPAVAPGPTRGPAVTPGRISEVKLPAYGNDATAIDEAGNLLYVASWAYGEVDQVDLKARRLRRRYLQAAVLPHMFNMAFNPGDGRLYIPLGATAVNGAFGSAVTILDPSSGALDKVRTGWAPEALLPQPGSDAMLAFGSEDQLARITPDGLFTIHDLPVLYPHQALATPAGNIYLAYGPHQSYWPVVYIWAARNGILGIDGRELGAFYDRRIPRLAQGLALTPEGVLYALQNNWGDEKQFYVALGDEVRAPNQGDMRVELEDTVSRETTQRLIAYDAERRWLYLARVGEKDEDSGILLVVDAGAGKILKRLEVGSTPTALGFDRDRIYVLGFDADALAVIDKGDFSRRDLACGRQPLKMALAGGVPYVINHGDNTLSELEVTPPKGRDATVRPRTWRIPFPGRPDQIATLGGSLLITSHSAGDLFIFAFDPQAKKFSLLHRERYPYGQASFAGNNSSFFLRGQFGDCLYDLCQAQSDSRGRIWVSDFLSGKVFIIGPR